MDNNYSFRDYLKQLMKNRNIKPSQLAARLNLDHSLVRKWLAGSRVPPLKSNYLDLIGSYLHLGPDEQLLLKKAQVCSIDEKIVTLTDQLQKAKDSADEYKQALISLLHAIPETAYLLDSAGRIIAANEITTRRLGLSESGLVGLDPFQHLAPDVAKHRQERIKLVFESGHPLAFKDYRGSHCILNSIYPVKNNKGAVTKVAVCGTDITDLEKAYALLKDSEESLRHLYENSFNPVLLTRPGDAILAANPAACDFFQMTEEEICTAGRGGIVDPADTPQALALVEGASTGRVRARLTFKNKSGTRKTALVSSAQFRDSAGNPSAYVVIHAIDSDGASLE